MEFACCFIFWGCFIQLRSKLHTPEQPWVHFWNDRYQSATTAKSSRQSLWIFILFSVASLGAALCLMSVDITLSSVWDSSSTPLSVWTLYFGMFDCALFCRIWHATSLTIFEIHVPLRIEMELFQIFIFRKVNPRDVPVQHLHYNIGSSFFSPPFDHCWSSISCQGAESANFCLNQN